MKIRQETDYAIRVIHALIKADGRPLLSKEIAASEGIPPNYILTIMCKLKAAGFVEMALKTKDHRGGYLLLTDPGRISLFDIITAFEGNIRINGCLSDKCKNNCPNMANCQIRIEMKRINDVLNEELKKKSLLEITDKESKDQQSSADCLI